MVAPSGTDTGMIVPGPWPATPVVGVVSGASPGRGIETLVESCRLLVPAVPRLPLRLFLAGATGAGHRFPRGGEKFPGRATRNTPQTPPHPPPPAALAG